MDTGGSRRTLLLATAGFDMQSKLKIRITRVAGDPAMPVNPVAASWGNVSLNPGIPLLSQSGVDLLVLGETHEWELVEYAQDAISSGKKKALVILGHVVSEQAGMKYCAEWLKSIITDVPVEFIAAPEPYWSPDNPAA
jgi:putative NIF3 family GTP cyclohydrolase 1 type 2